MKGFWQSMSITKLVFLTLTLVLSFVTIWNTLHWLDNQIFETIISMTFAFYFWQKGISYSETDSLVKDTDEKTEIIWYDLQNNKEEEDGGDN